ncbi:MAG: VOC family protein [Planctomycetota bacterium]|nr:VOC family protein [Planctomycetota bacterium]
MTLLRHLAIRCRDMERSRDFYATVFGWEFIGYRPSGLGLDFSDGVNNITLLQQPDGMQRPALEEGNEYIHFGVIVDDLIACWHRCREWGAEISKGDVKDRTEIEQDALPARSFKVLDPDGNVIDVTANKEEWRGIAVEHWSRS